MRGCLRNGERLALSAAIAVFAVFVPASSCLAFTARSADSFVNSIGVNVHMSYVGTPYYDQRELVEQRLAELGVRHVRDGLVPGRPDEYAALEELAAMGIGSTLILGSAPLPTTELNEELIPVLEGDLAGAVEAVEGPNEYSTSGDPEWKAHLIAYQRALYESIKGNSGLSQLPVIGPSIVHGDQAELGDISEYLDYGNIHSYPEGEPPDNLGSFIKKAELNSGPEPIFATETGYTTAINWTPAGNGENRPVSEAAMATYVPRLFLEYFRWGIVRTFSYELVDEWPDPDLEDREANFGLLRNDLSKKPAFSALANTIHILEDPGPTFSPGSLDYSLSDQGVELPSGESSGLHKVLLQKRDGSFYLALWRTTSVWDPVAKEPLEAPAEPVTVGVPAGMEIGAEYLPNSSSEPVWTATAPTQSLTVDVGPEVAILEAVPAATTTTPAEPEPPVSPATDSEPPATYSARPAPAVETPVRHCRVPRLQRRRLRTARRALIASGCRLGRVRGRRSQAARVRKQGVAPGRVLRAGARVSVTLALQRQRKP